MDVIPLSKLRRACKAQREIVCREWPDGIPVTEDSALRAVARRLDIDWAASELLTASALAEYERAMAPALAEYERVAAPAEYERVAAPALAEYDRVRALCLLRLLVTEKS